MDSETERYLRSIYGPGDKLAVVRLREERASQQIATVENIVKPVYLRYLERENAAGWNVYLGQAVLKPSATSRRIEDVSHFRSLFFDVDKNGIDALGRVMKNDKVPQPNWIIQSSPGKYQVIWKTAPLSPEIAERYLRGLALEFGADPQATDVSRCLRLPGNFANRKYPELPKVELVATPSVDRVHDLSEFNVRLDIERERWREELFRRDPAQGHALDFQRSFKLVRGLLDEGFAPERVRQIHAEQLKAIGVRNAEYKARVGVSRALRSQHVKREYEGLGYGR
jgi:RepB DNA-primase N-terminal domain